MTVSLHSSVSPCDTFAGVTGERWRSCGPEGHQSAPQRLRQAQELVDIRRVFDKQAGDSQRCCSGAQQQAPVNHLWRTKRPQVSRSIAQASAAGPFLIFDQVKATMTREGRVWILNPPASECLRLPKVGEKEGKRGERPGSGQDQPQSPCGRKSLMMLFAPRTKLKTRRH